MNRAKRHRNKFQRMRDNQYATARRRAWFRYYRDRMKKGLEHCRRCHTTEQLTYGHLVAATNGGRLTRDNLTILCIECQIIQGVATWNMPSLADEEKADSLHTSHMQPGPSAQLR